MNIWLGQAVEQVIFIGMARGDLTQKVTFEQDLKALRQQVTWIIWGKSNPGRYSMFKGPGAGGCLAFQGRAQRPACLQQRDQEGQQ